jgi:acyl-CoA synthetase (AMP-forming)/AMP-acid ligase II
MHDYLPLTLADLLETNARHYGYEPAYVCGERRLTHAQVLERARRLGSALHRAGLQRQDRVAILAMNCLEYMETYSAGWLNGFIVATVNFRLAAPEIAWIINNSSPKLLIFEAQYAAVIERLRPELKSVETYVCIGEGAPDWAQSYEAFVAGGDPAGPPFRAREEDLACIIHTSGTTGRPKGCMLGQREMRLWGLVMSGEQRSGPGDRLLLVMPLFHVGALGVGIGQHFRGGTIHLHRQFDPAAMLAAIERERISIIHVAPTMVQMLLALPDIEQTDVSSLHTVLYAAAPMPGPVLKRGLEIFGNVFMQYYGQTEVIGTTLFKEHHRPDGDARDRARLMSVGLPFANTLVRIVDDAGCDCALGTPGEILMKSTMMFRGYWNNDAATLETIRDGWCHTGDVGKFDDQGFLYLVDRKKDMIISGGENIYSREVEEAVLQHPAVSEVAVIGVPDAKWGEAVCAVVVLKPGIAATEAELIEHTRTLIASYKKPRSVRFVSELPKMPSGKVSKLELRRLYPA